MSTEYWHTGGSTGLFMRAALRTLQFVFAVIIAALYGVDLAHSTATKSRANSAWVFAEVVSALSIITCAVHCFVTVKRVAWCAWDFFVFILWIAQFGVFATVYIGGGTDSAEGFETLSVSRMKAAVWLDAINALLWFVTFVSGIAFCCTARRVTRGTKKGDLEAEAQGVFTQVPDGSEMAMVDDKEDLDKLGNRDSEEKVDHLKPKDSDLDSLATTLTAVDSLDLAVDMTKLDEASKGNQNVM
ncbi:hypothetical protein GLAREA_04948 [Glarea lozoyensis ATCC 20868]|uniref:MARVEL domain-containing protein n=1 Tax=Glarea lozoyensis (strain ATCC 20868 / MF5171) TaxID=1116229 RepID=S3CNR4_GLAL2|nr:uncharacterized protein GLAREA_04948 [Glarea lozoyensis ATCC 20868]EPE28157.1 hypothetical protein GLAREA_04948 [Glarea lozoyensis ATCC 20868]